MEHAIIYTRQSTAREESISLELQETACREYAARKGYNVLEVVSDPGVSGLQFAKRPGIRRALDLVEDHSATVVLVWRWSRLSRRRIDQAVILDRIEKAGARAESATEPIDTTTAGGRFSREVLLAAAAMESDVKSEQWKEAQARRVARGLPSDGTPRFGYRKAEDRTYEPDPVAGPALREAYLAYTRGAGYQTLVKRLNDAGLMTSRGTAWTTHTLRRCLDSGFGAGLLVTRKGGQEKFLPGSHEPVITSDEWEAFRRARDTRTRKPSKLRSPKWYLAGIVRCGYCGATLSVGSFKDPKGNALCSAYKNSRTCKGVWVPRWMVEHSVTNWVGAHVSEIAAHAWDTSQRDEARDEIERRLAAARERHESAQSALQRLAHGYATGLLDKASVTAARPDLEAERAAAEDEVASLYAELDALLPVDADEYLRMASATEEMSPSEWGHLLSRVLREVRVTHDEFEFVPVVGEPRTVSRPPRRQGARATQPRSNGRFAARP